MAKKIEDYLRYYIGCQCLIGSNTHVKYIKLVSDQSVCIDVKVMDNGDLIPIWYKASACKPILRKLEDMTDEDKKAVGFEGFQMLRNEHGDRVIPLRDKGYQWAARQTHYLLSKGFDLFGLIDEGLAVDQNTITQTT